MLSYKHNLLGQLMKQFFIEFTCLLFLLASFLVSSSIPCPRNIVKGIHGLMFGLGQMLVWSYW